ncbi:MAG: hypothetical protein KHX03_05380 [Clostridium sp.]|nr:hypothetical protein [Clostridium sp.]
MGNLINTIPVYKPQVTNNATPPAVQKPVHAIQKEFSQYQNFSYIPAEPLSPATTTPKGVKPHSPNGYLVKENIFQSAASTIKSYADYAKYFYKAAFKGEGTDYSVGKINDLAIRTGSLGIAAVLATSKLFPFAKGMEFVGLATWFASMAIWPRVIGAPIKMATGVDINQKYVDSYGRRKNFFEDPQYLAWDLYRHIDKKGNYNKEAPDYEKLDLIGDKLGIPRDIKNRREAIQDKMRQIAIQGNTLWMLTAGIMTPVLSSIAADSLQKPLQNTLENIRTKRSEQKASNLTQNINNLLMNNTNDISHVMKKLQITPDKAVVEEFETILGGESNRLSTESFKKLQDFISKRYFATGIQTAVSEEMKYAMDASEPIIHITENFKSDLQKLTANAIKEAVEMVPADKKNLIPKRFLDYKGLQPHEISAALQESGIKFGEEEIGLVKQDSVKNLLARKVIWTVNEEQNVDKSLIKVLRNIINKKADAYFEQVRYNKVDTDKMRKIFNFAETNLALKERIAEIEKATIMNISESSTAINWERVPQKYLQALGFNKAEMLEIAATDSHNAAKLVTRKFEEIAADSNKYGKVLNQMSKYAAKASSKEEKAVIEMIGTYENPGLLYKVKQLMTRVSSHNFSHTMTDNIEKQYAMNIRSVYQKLVNTIDSFTRPIKALDTFKNIDEIVNKILGANVEEFKNNLNNRPVYYSFVTPKPLGMSDNDFYAKEFERAQNGLKRYIKDIVLQKNDINNWTTKFESVIPGYKKGINHSKTMLWNIANEVNGPVSEETLKAILENCKNEGEKGLIRQFIEKANRNTERLKFHFMGTFNKIWPHANEGEILKGLVDSIFNKNDFSKVSEVEARLRDRVHDIGRIDVDRYMQVIYDYRDKFSKIKDYNREEAIKYVLSKLNYSVANKPLAERSGKNVTDFVIGAAENACSRNKWSKLAMGLLIGTSALTLLTIGFMGRKNYFNKDQYEPLNPTSPEGVTK